MDEQAIQQLYAWIDEIVLSRPKRNITRDFSDGVLAAEIVAHFLPGLVELHNYTPANNSQQKRTNWETLNRKVFKKIDFNVPSNIINGIIMCKQGVIEIVLYNLRVKILNYKKKEEEEETEESGSDIKSEPGQWNGAQHPHNPYYPDASMGQYPHHHHPQYPPPSDVFRHQPPATHPNYHPVHIKQNNGENNGSLATIPFDSEQQQQQPKKKKSPKKKKTPAQSAPNADESERSKSLPLSLSHLDHESRIFIQEREQALLQSQETVQILQSKISRLEHLLQLKDLRIEDLDNKLKAALQRGGRPAKR